MTRITVRCPECDQAAGLQPDSIRWISCSHGAQYVWRCPGCDTHVSRPANTSELLALRSGGVRGLIVTPEPRTDAPPLTDDDVIAFGQELEAFHGYVA